MKIRKLFLKSFGKFSDKEVEFKDGLNLVYGNNEAGKSTTHSFIKGMFFGFFKPYSKNKIYSSEYEKYKPWNSNLYKGNLEFVIGKKDYRIERNFDRNNEEFKLLDNVTGEDITPKLPYDGSIKQRVISPVIKLNPVLFSNTVSVSQLKNKTEEDLKKEISETIANYEKGNNNNISVNKAIEKLENQKAEIGTRKQSKSLYGSTILKYAELKEEKKKILKAIEENKQYYVEIKKLEDELLFLRRSKKKIATDKNNLLRDKEKAIFLKYKAIEKENEKILQEIKEVEKYKSIDKSIYREFLNLYSENESLTKQLNTLREKEEYVNSVLNNLDSEQDAINKQTKGKDYNRIINDIEILEDRLGNIERLNSRLSSKQDDKVEKDYSSKSNINKGINIILVISAILSCFMLAFSFTITKELLIYFYISLAATVILGIIKLIVMFVFKETSKKFEKYDTSLIRTQNMIELNEVEIKRLLDEYEEQDPYKLIEVLKEKSVIAKNAINSFNQKEKYKMNLEDFEGDETSLIEKIKENREKMNEILSENDIQSVDDFLDSFDKKANYDKLIHKYENNNKLLINIIDGNDIHELEKKFDGEEIDESVLEAFKSGEGELLSSSLEEINEQIGVTLSSLARIKGIVEKEDKGNELCVIDEKLNKYKMQIKEYEYKLLSLETAISTIKDISKNIHSHVAPNLNKTLGEIMSKITGGKYSSVKVDDNMNIMVLDENSGQMVSAETLSNGTIDQIYLALRFSIIDNLLLDSRMPIMIDDSFIQYDDDRLKEVLSYLLERAKTKQIIMFTCQTREEKILNELGGNYNKITL